MTRFLLVLDIPTEDLRAAGSPNLSELTDALALDLSSVYITEGYDAAGWLVGVADISDALPALLDALEVGLGGVEDTPVADKIGEAIDGFRASLAVLPDGYPNQ